MTKMLKIGAKKSGAGWSGMPSSSFRSHTFGIPGVHNTEIYDELEPS